MVAYTARALRTSVIIVIPAMFHSKTVLLSVCFAAALAGAEPAMAQSRAEGADAQVEELHSTAIADEKTGDLAGAARNYEQILRIAPTLAAAYNNLGSVYFRQREYDKAVAVLGKGLKIDPAMTSAAALLGMSLYETGKYAEARPWLEQAFNANRSDANIELFLVNDLTRLGEFEPAAFHLQRLTNRKPTDEHLWYLLAKVYLQLGRDALARMNAINPDSVWAHQISGEIMEGMKNYEGAIVEYKKAVEIAPRQPGTHYKLGDVYWSLSQWNNAMEQFQAELSNDPKNCMAQWKIGDVLLQQNVKPEEALRDVEKALAMCPGLTEARVDRGKLLLQLHRNDEALADLQAAAKATPDDAAVHFLLARAYRALGRATEAQLEKQTFSQLEERARAATAEKAQEVIKNKAEGN
jgi:tetratricopeptide (TPR) repeat protein